MARVIKRVAGPLVRTAKVKLIKGVILGAGVIGKPGEIYELPKYLASEIVSYGLAAYTDEGDPLEHDETPAGVPRGVPGDEHASVTVEQPTNRDPKPKKRG